METGIPPFHMGMLLSPFPYGDCHMENSAIHELLREFAVEDFFSNERLNARKQEELVPMSYLCGEAISYVS